MVQVLTCGVSYGQVLSNVIMCVIFQANHGGIRGAIPEKYLFNGEININAQNQDEDDIEVGDPVGIAKEVPYCIAYKHTLFDIFKLQYLIFHPTCTLRTSEMILLNKHSHFGMSYMTRQWQYLQMEIACFTYHLHIYLSVRSVKSKLNGDPLLCKISYVSVFSNQVHKYCFKSFQLMKYLSKLSVC